MTLLLVMVACGSQESRGDDPAKVLEELSATASTHGAEATSAPTTPSTLGSGFCPALADAVPGCEERWPVQESGCPTRQDVLWIEDADALTLSEGVWKPWRRDLWRVQSSSCPLGDPLSQHFPGRCASIQDVGEAGVSAALAGCDPYDPHPFSPKSGRTSTPATAAVRTACRAMLSVAGYPGVIAVAFDGVADEAGTGAAADRFSKSIAECVGGGIAVRAVANPHEYKYVYVLSRAPFHAYADDMADYIAGRMSSEHASALVFSLSPHSYATATGSPEVQAGATVAAESGGTKDSQPSSSLTPIKGPNGLSVANLSGWVTRPSPLRQIWRLRWKSSVGWPEGGPAGLRFPVVARSNLAGERPVARFPEESATWQMLAPGAAGVDSCPSPYRPPPTDSSCHHEDVALYMRGRQEGGLGGDNSVFIEAMRTPVDVTPDAAFAPAGAADAVSEWMGLTRDPVKLPGVGVIMERAQLDPCALALESALIDVDRWNVSDSTTDRLARNSPGLDKACVGSGLEALYRAISSTRGRSFAATKDRLGGGRDRRVGMGTLVQSMTATARTLIAGSATWPGVSQECLLGGFLVVYDCGVE